MHNCFTCRHLTACCCHPRPPYCSCCGTYHWPGQRPWFAPAQPWVLPWPPKPFLQRLTRADRDALARIGGRK